MTVPVILFVELYLSLLFLSTLNKIDNSSFFSDYCPSPVSFRGLITTGSLDVVLVISHHASMIENRNHPRNYMKQLGLSRRWRRFQDVRIGVVVFGGSENEFNPHAVIQQSDNR